MGAGCSVQRGDHPLSPKLPQRIHFHTSFETCEQPKSQSSTPITAPTSSHLPTSSAFEVVAHVNNIVKKVTSDTFDNSYSYENDDAVEIGAITNYDESDVAERSTYNMSADIVFEAVDNGDLRMIEKCIETNTSLLLFDDSGQSLLHRAVKMQQYKILRALLSAPGIDVDIPNVDFATALHVACAGKDVEAVKILLEAGCNVNAQDASGRTVLLVAAIYQAVEILPLLLTSEGLDPDLSDNRGLTAVHIAAIRGDLSALDVLLSHGASVDAASGKGCTALHYACKGGHIDMVKYLLSKAGASVHVQDVANASPLHYAVEQQHERIVKMLLKCGASVHLVDSAGRTPLYEALAAHNTGIASAILAAGARVNVVDSEGVSPLYFAAREGQLPLVVLLVNASANVNMPNRPCTDGSLLRPASESQEEAEETEGTPQAVEEKEEVPTVLSSALKYTLTALHVASLFGFGDIVEYLLQQGADIGQTGGNALTALHFAALARDEEIIKLLLRFGADMNARDVQEQSALEYLTSLLPESLSTFENVAKEFAAGVSAPQKTADKQATAEEEDEVHDSKLSQPLFSSQECELLRDIFGQAVCENLSSTEWKVRENGVQLLRTDLEAVSDSVTLLLKLAGLMKVVTGLAKDKVSGPFLLALQCVEGGLAHNTFDEIPGDELLKMLQAADILPLLLHKCEDVNGRGGRRCLQLLLSLCHVKQIGPVFVASTIGQTFFASVDHYKKTPSSKNGRALYAQLKLISRIVSDFDPNLLGPVLTPQELISRLLVLSEHSNNKIRQLAIETIARLDHCCSVLANSDMQSLKPAVRDAIIAQSQKLGPTIVTVPEHQNANVSSSQNKNVIDGDVEDWVGVVKLCSSENWIEREQGLKTFGNMVIRTRSLAALIEKCGTTSQMVEPLQNGLLDATLAVYLTAIDVCKSVLEHPDMPTIRTSFPVAKLLRIVIDRCYDSSSRIKTRSQEFLLRVASLPSVGAAVVCNECIQQHSAKSLIGRLAVCTEMVRTIPLEERVDGAGFCFVHLMQFACESMNSKDAKTRSAAMKLIEALYEQTKDEQAVCSAISELRPSLKKAIVKRLFNVDTVGATEPSQVAGGDSPSSATATTVPKTNGTSYDHNDGAVGSLPKAAALAPDVEQRAGPLIDIYGYDVISCFMSTTWSHREAALLHIQSRLSSLFSDSNSSVSPSILMQSLSFILSAAFRDPVVNVYFSALSLFRVILDSARAFVSVPELLKWTTFLMPFLVQRLADNNAKVRGSTQQIFQLLMGSSFLSSKKEVLIEVLLDGVKSEKGSAGLVSRFALIYDLAQRASDQGDIQQHVSHLMSAVNVACCHAVDAVRQAGARIYLLLKQNVGASVDSYLSSDIPEGRLSMLVGPATGVRPSTAKLSRPKTAAEGLTPRSADLLRAPLPDSVKRVFGDEVMALLQSEDPNSKQTALNMIKAKIHLYASASYSGAASSSAVEASKDMFECLCAILKNILPDCDATSFIISLKMLKHSVPSLSNGLSSFELHFYIGSLITAVLTRTIEDNNVKIHREADKFLLFLCRLQRVGSDAVCRNVFKLLEKAATSASAKDRHCILRLCNVLSNVMDEFGNILIHQELFMKEALSVLSRLIDREERSINKIVHQVFHSVYNCDTARVGRIIESLDGPARILWRKRVIEMEKEADDGLMQVKGMTLNSGYVKPPSGKKKMHVHHSDDAPLTAVGTEPQRSPRGNADDLAPPLTNSRYAAFSAQSATPTADIAVGADSTRTLTPGRPPSVPSLLTRRQNSAERNGDLLDASLNRSGAPSPRTTSPRTTSPFTTSPRQFSASPSRATYVPQFLQEVPSDPVIHDTPFLGKFSVEATNVPQVHSYAGMQGVTPLHSDVQAVPVAAVSEADAKAAYVPTVRSVVPRRLPSLPKPV
eukprot:GILJ01009286.1.p1 GENE.GILJ01009286.1~~GILJ01009286.1.p1  ORF type:complete len:1906 (+),score=241.01 GILJ01009286.1:81-5798(+)